jgi:cell division transport system permease protein
VRRPFLYHGLFYGLSGALVACALVLFAALSLAGPLERLGAEYAGDFDLSGPGPAHFAALLLGGSALGLVGAWLSVGRHLRAVEPR